MARPRRREGYDARPSLSALAGWLAAATAVGFAAGAYAASRRSPSALARARRPWSAWRWRAARARQQVAAQYRQFVEDTLPKLQVLAIRARREARDQSLVMAAAMAYFARKAALALRERWRRLTGATVPAWADELRRAHASLRPRLADSAARIRAFAIAVSAASVRLWRAASRACATALRVTGVMLWRAAAGLHPFFARLDQRLLRLLRAGADPLFEVRVQLTARIVELRLSLATARRLAAARLASIGTARGAASAWVAGPEPAARRWPWPEGLILVHGLHAEARPNAPDGPLLDGLAPALQLANPAGELSIEFGPQARDAPSDAYSSEPLAP